MASQATPRALVVLRVPRGAQAPGEEQIRSAIMADRSQLALPPGEVLGYQIAGPYGVLVAGKAFDEYVVWEA